MLINLFDRAQAIVRDLLEFKDMVSIFGKYYIYANTVTSLVSCLNRRKPYVTDIPRTELRREEKVHLWN